MVGKCGIWERKRDLVWFFKRLPDSYISWELSVWLNPDAKQNEINTFKF